MDRLKLDLRVPDPERLARVLGLSRRSLERRLRTYGASLSPPLDEARREVACASLRVPDQPIKDIAFRVGFSEPSAFHRAFKRWTGMTPACFRHRFARRV